MHLFLHNNECIFDCVWDGHITFDEKREIMLNMLKWWSNYNTTLHSRIINNEDDSIFSEIIKELNS